MTEPIAPTGTPDAAPPGLSHRRAFARRALATYGTSGATAILSLLNVLVISRTLGATGRGGVAFLMTVAYLSAQLASLGIQQAMANIGGREAAVRRHLAGNALVFTALLSLLAVGGVVLLTVLVPAAGGGSAASARAIALGAVPAVILSDYLSPLLTSNYRFAVVNAAALATPLLILTLNSTLAAVGALSVRTAVAAWVAGQFAATSICGIAVARTDGFGRPDAALGRRMAVFGLKTHGGRVLNFGNYRLDQWLVGSIAGPRQLGLYSVAVAWSEGLFLLPGAVAGVQRPDLVRADAETARRRALRAHRLVQGATLLLAIGLIVLARPLCVGVFGNDFSGSVNQLRLLAVGSLGIVALKMLGDALIAQHRPLLESAAVASAFVCTVVLDILLIPHHGGAGAAAASTIAYTTGGAIAFILFLRTVGARAARS